MTQANPMTRSWAIVRQGCSMSYFVAEDGDIEFRFGSQFDGFEVVFDAVALREFMGIAGRALG